jgi:hypothetical protein
MKTAFIGYQCGMPLEDWMLEQRTCRRSGPVFLFPTDARKPKDLSARQALILDSRRAATVALNEAKAWQRCYYESCKPSYRVWVLDVLYVRLRRRDGTIARIGQHWAFRTMKNGTSASKESRVCPNE